LIFFACRKQDRQERPEILVRDASCIIVEGNDQGMELGFVSAATGRIR
jgi:hypothetical protein